MIFSDETTVRLNTIKGLEWKLPRKKKIVRTVKHLTKVNVWDCFSSQGFGRIVCFKQNLNAKLMCDIYKRGLVPAAQKNLVSIRQSGNCNKITISNTCRNSHSTGKQDIEPKKLIGHRCHLIFHLLKMFGNFSI